MDVLLEKWNSPGYLFVPLKTLSAILSSTWNSITESTYVLNYGGHGSHIITAKVAVYQVVYM